MPPQNRNFFAEYRWVTADYFHTVVSLAENYEAAALLAPGAPVSFVKPPDAACSTPERLRRYRALLLRLDPDLLVTYGWGAIEHGPTNEIFTRPSDERTERYVTGKFG